MRNKYDLHPHLCLDISATYHLRSSEKRRVETKCQVYRHAMDVLRPSISSPCMFSMSLHQSFTLSAHSLAFTRLALNQSNTSLHISPTSNPSLSSPILRSTPESQKPNPAKLNKPGNATPLFHHVSPHHPPRVLSLRPCHVPPSLSTDAPEMPVNFTFPLAKSTLAYLNALSSNFSTDPTSNVSTAHTDSSLGYDPSFDWHAYSTLQAWMGKDKVTVGSMVGKELFKTVWHLLDKNCPASMKWGICDHIPNAEFQSKCMLQWPAKTTTCKYLKSNLDDSIPARCQQASDRAGLIIFLVIACRHNRHMENQSKVVD